MIHPADAAVRGIAHEDVVTVRNGRGSFKAQARVTEDAMAGVVVAPLGFWVAGSIAGATPAALNPTAFADLGRAPTFSDNLVEVVPG
jgi:anaerobic selenocysteine-containing dehydrogenase